MQLQHDLKKLYVCEGFDWITEDLCLNPEQMFHEDNTEIFKYSFFGCLRHSDFFCEYPPAEWQPPGPLLHAHQPLPEQVFQCQLILADGSQYKYTCDSLKSLRSHVGTAKVHREARATLILASAFVQTNQCPWCSGTFSSKQTAQNHCRLAQQNGGICAETSKVRFPQLVQVDVHCVQCDIGFDSLDEYNSHCVEHHCIEDMNVLINPVVYMLDSQVAAQL